MTMHVAAGKKKNIKQQQKLDWHVWENMFGLNYYQCRRDIFLNKWIQYKARFINALKTEIQSKKIYFWV